MTVVTDRTSFTGTTPVNLRTTHLLIHYQLRRRYYKQIEIFWGEVAPY